MYKVFISHSVTPEDYSLVTSIANVLWQQGMEAYIPEWYPRYPEDTAKVSKVSSIQIDACDFVLGVITNRSKRQSWVHQELGYALGKGKPVLALAEEGTNVEPLFTRVGKINVVYFARWNFAEAADRVLDGFRQQQEKAHMEAFGGLILLGLGLWFLSQLGKSKE